MADDSLVGRLGPEGFELYTVGQRVFISLVMASLIGWLAVRYRRGYEEQLQARNATLEATRDFLARIIEGSAEAIITLDAAGRVTSWNRSAETIYGWSAAEMIGQRTERLVPPELLAAGEVDRLEELIRKGVTLRDYETTRRHKDGRDIMLRVTRSPLYGTDGVFVGSTGIVRDVTALKEMEARLVESERLAAVGELSALVAHEIKNPLAGIRGACEILTDGFPEGDGRREIAVEVVRQIDRLDRTVRDLLLFARPQARRPQPTDLHSILDRVLGVLLDDSQNRSITVERRFAPVLPMLQVDPQQMEQVFFNLLLNAFQAVDLKGTVIVTTEAVGREVRIHVEDSGPGVRDELREKIFKPFFTTRTKGTGLGLAIVKNIAQAHGGSIAVATAPSGGAVFTLALPNL